MGTPVKYCDGQKSSGEKISAICSYPGYHCYCTNRAHEYPSCHCSRETPHPTTTPLPALATTLPGDTVWKPLYVLGIGGGVLIVVILTSIACCCVCRHWYTQNLRAVPDKPPEYSDSPPPPYVHSSFYNRDANRPRTVHRITRAPAHSSRSATRNVASAVQQHNSRNMVPGGMVSCQSEQNIRVMRSMQSAQHVQSAQSTQHVQDIRGNQVVRTEMGDHRTLSSSEIDRVSFPTGRYYYSDDIAIVDLDDV